MITKEMIEAAMKSAPQFWRDTDNFDKHISKMLTAAFAAMPGRGVKVKQLEFVEEVPNWFVARALGSTYEVRLTDRGNVRVRNPIDRRWEYFHGEIQDALRAMNSDYKARILSALTPAPDLAAENERLPQDVINLVIAAREFWEIAMDESDESAALDFALEAFSSRVPYENDPAEDRAALERT